MVSKFCKIGDALVLFFDVGFGRFRDRFLGYIRIVGDAVKMSFLVQNLVFYRVDLLSRLCNIGVKSVAEVPQKSS